MQRSDGVRQGAFLTGFGYRRRALPALLLCGVFSGAGACLAAEPPEQAIETKPLPAPTPDYSAEAEAERVNRLQLMLRSHYREKNRATAESESGPAETAAREAARRDAANLAKIPFSASKVRLSGSEGSTALAQITERLYDPTIPENRRDVAPVCSIKTRLDGTLVASERRSLWPVGKNNYVAKLRLQPGTTTLGMQGYAWEIILPEDLHSREYLVTVYKPPGVKPELHVFSIADLLALDEPHIPAWLPEQLGITSSG